MPKNLNLLLTILLTLGILTGAFLGYQRFLIEKNNHALQIVINYAELLQLSNGSEVSLESIFHKFKENGLTSIALPEETLDSALEEGELVYASGYQILNSPLALENLTFGTLLAKGQIKTSCTYLLINDPKTLVRIKEELALALGEGKVKTLGTVLEVQYPLSELRLLGLGLNPRLYTYLKDRGFNIIPRPKNNEGLTAQTIEQKISNLAEKRKVEEVVFNEKEVLGYPDNLKITAHALKYHEIKYGKIEILKQEGDLRLANYMADQVVLCHSIEKEHLEKLSPPGVVKRVVAAAKERKVRIIFLNPFIKNIANPLEFNLEHLKNMKEALEKAGFVLTSNPNATTTLKPSFICSILLGLGVMTGVILLLKQCMPLPALITNILLLLSLLFSTIFYAAGWEVFSHKAYALAAALTFPAYALVTAFSQSFHNQYSWRSVLSVFSNILIDTCMGIILIVGLLADSRFMSGGILFGGIKLTLVIPILLTAGILFFKENNQDLKETLRSFLALTFKMWQILLGALVLGILAVLLLRSGNFGLPVPGFERGLRNLLSEALIVRPRFKEFLIGYPALLIGIIYLTKGYKKGLWVFAAIGSIGLTSLINTFCHIHSPLMISLLRSINGLVWGILMGLVFYWLFSRYLEPYLQK